MLFLVIKNQDELHTGTCRGPQHADGHGMSIADDSSEPEVPGPALASLSPSAITPSLRLAPITRATSMPLDESVFASHSGLLGPTKTQPIVDIYRGFSQPLPSLSVPREEGASSSMESMPSSGIRHHFDHAEYRSKRPSVTGQIRESENSLITLEMERLIEVSVCETYCLHPLMFHEHWHLNEHLNEAHDSIDTLARVNPCMQVWIII